MIGRTETQDIQLLGLGIMPEHCIIVIEGSDVYLEPVEGARSLL